MFDDIAKQFSFFENVYFGCHKGWKKILWQLALDIDKELKSCPKEIQEEFEITEVKEKYGYLTIYSTYANDNIYKLIDEAEEKSKTICEICGSFGIEKSKNGWLFTRCDNCFPD